MWYGLIRLGIIIVLFFVLRKIYLKKKKNINKIVFTVFLILAIILGLFISYVPFEDLFITFSSPEAAYHYSRMGSVDAVLEGDDSAMIISFRGSETAVTIFPKSKKGWKLGSALTDHNSRIIESDYFIVVYSYNKTDDYYILVSDSVTQNINDVSDNKGSQFEKHIERFKGTNIENIKYYAYIKDYDDNYELIINGSKVKFDD